MKRVGGKAVVAWALAQGANNAPDKRVPEDESTQRRALAMAAIAGHVDPKNREHVKALFAIARDTQAPDEVVDQAFARIRELPREAVIADLYGFFDLADWRRRRLAGA